MPKTSLKKVKKALEKKFRTTISICPCSVTGTVSLTMHSANLPGFARSNPHLYGYTSLGATLRVVTPMRKKNFYYDISVSEGEDSVWKKFPANTSLEDILEWIEIQWLIFTFDGRNG